MEKTKKSLLLFFFLLCINIAFTQPVFSEKTEEGQNRFYFYWGWNRAWYTKSDLHFTGKGYDFELENVVAKDRQSKFSFRKYFSPSQITIPQTNYGIGYFIRPNYILSLAVDHMKYVVQHGQSVQINGHISDLGTPYHGIYEGEEIELKKDFLELEHTDGLNYLHAGLDRSDNLLKNSISLHNKLEINLLESFGAGIFLPKTDARLLNFEKNNTYHLAGYGLSGRAGLMLVFFRHFFLKFELRGGFVNLTSVRTTPDASDKATQHFWYVQPTGQFGGIFNL